MIKAQLANPIDDDRMLRKLDLDRYFQADWWWQQKLDGDRLLLQIADGEIVGTNRNGEPTKHATFVRRIAEHLFDLNGHWVLDGELCDDVFFLFDLPIAIGVIDLNTPYMDRYAALEGLFNAKIKDRTDKIQLVPVMKTVEEKADLILWCQQNDAEGIMVKQVMSPYYAGKRSDRTLKMKFWESCDCVITELWREGKRSIGVEVYDEAGEPVDIGSVTMSERNLAKVHVGDVVEVKYLYVGSNNRLYQPSFLRVRTDKAPQECVTGQLKYVNKTVRT